MIEIINKPLLLQLVGYLYYWQIGFNSVFKGLIKIREKTQITTFYGENPRPSSPNTGVHYESIGEPSSDVTCVGIRLSIVKKI